MALLELTNVSKSFGGVQALRSVDFTLLAGQIHGLAGENGAGKSTMMKIIAGVHTADSGRMRVDGKDVHFRSTRDALAAGIGMVHQELSVAPELSVAENVYFGNQPINRFGVVAWRRMAETASEQLKNLGLEIDPRARLGDFPIGVQQLVELSRVLFSGARIIILDEPTSALSPPEIERLFGVLARAARERPQHHLHFAFPRRHPEDLGRDHHLSQRPQGRDDRSDAGHRQGLDHRAHDRRRPRGAGGELSRRDQARQPPRRAGRRCAPRG